MSSPTVQYAPGISRELRIGVDGLETRIVVGVEYNLACEILNSSAPVTQGLIRAENGALDLHRDFETFDLLDGKVHLRSDTRLTPDTLCFELVSHVVSDAEDWEWAKVTMSGGPFDGLNCLGVKHETKEAVLVAL